MSVFSNGTASLCETLYANLCVTPSTEPSVGTVLSAIDEFCEEQTKVNYVTMANSIQNWMYGKTDWSSTKPTATLLASVGLPLNTTYISGFHVNVYNSLGERVFDSRVKGLNQFENIGIPDSSFLTTGKYKIGKPNGFNATNIGATFSQTGTFRGESYNKTDELKEYRLSARVGESAEISLGWILITCGTKSKF